MSDEVLARLNTESRLVVALAEEEAKRRGHSYIGTEHLLLALCGEEKSIAVRVIRVLGIDLLALRELAEKHIGHDQQAPAGPLPFTPQVEKALEFSRQEAQRLSYENIGSEHVLLGLIGEGDGIAAQVLMRLGVDPDRIREVAVEIRWRNSARRVIDHFAENLTQRASEGDLGPVIGRDQEIRQVMDALSLPAINNPVLVGGTSQGRMEVLEGLAQKIASGEVPEAIRNKQLYAFDPNKLAASSQLGGTQDPQLRIRIRQLIRGLGGRAQMENVSTAKLEQQPAAGTQIADEESGHRDVVVAILAESRSADDIILFISELPEAADAGVPDGAIYLTPILKHLLASGELQIISEGTARQYRESLDRDQTLAPWLRPVYVAEPTIAYTVGKLRIALRAASQARILAG